MFPNYSLCQSFSHVRLFVIPWTVVRQTPLSMEFSGQEYLRGLLFPPPGDLPRDPIRVSCIAGRFFTIRATGKPGTQRVAHSLVQDLKNSEHFST